MVPCVYVYRSPVVSIGDSASFRARSYLPRTLTAGTVAEGSRSHQNVEVSPSVSHPPRAAFEIVVTSHSQVHFEQRGSELVAIEIGHVAYLPVIGSIHRALFALGLDISSYRARPGVGGVVERIVLERHDGGRIDGALSEEAKAAILPIALRLRSGAGRAQREPAQGENAVSALAP